MSQVISYPCLTWTDPLYPFFDNEIENTALPWFEKTQAELEIALKNLTESLGTISMSG